MLGLGIYTPWPTNGRRIHVPLQFSGSSSTISSVVVQPETTSGATTGDDDKEDDEWDSFSRTTVARNCKWITDPGSVEGIDEALLSAAVLSVERGGTGKILVFFDSKSAGEATSRAHLRTCPFRDDFMSRTVKGVLRAMKSTEEIPENAYFVLFVSRPNGK